MKRSLIALALLTAGLAPAAAAHAAVETCRGETATLVGVEGEPLVGTDGDDVIVSNGASNIKALDGDDLICLTRNSFDLKAGFGDDVVDVSADKHGADVDLGGGSDTFYGSGSQDHVNAGDGDDARRGLPIGTDVIDTGDQMDFVATGVEGLPNLDTVRLGDAKDIAEVRGAVPALLDGGAGRDTLKLRNKQASAYIIDATTGTVTRDAIAMLPAASFAIWDVSELRWSSLDFQGSDRSDRLTAIKLGWKVKDGPLTADLGDGRDTLEIRLGNTGPFNGGEGRDRIEIRNESNRDLGGPFVANLRSDTYRFEGDAVVAIPGFEDLYAYSFAGGFITGDAGRNRLQAAGCPIVIRGGAGNDYLDGSSSKQCITDGPARGATLYGGAGDDRMIGSGLADRLYGGPGRDTAFGSSGRDVCAAEVRTDCER